MLPCTFGPIKPGSPGKPGSPFSPWAVVLGSPFSPCSNIENKVAVETNVTLIGDEMKP